MEFPQFRPPQSILEQICRDQKEGLVVRYHIIPNQTETADTSKRIILTMEDIIRMEVSSLTHSVAEYFFWDVDIEKYMDRQKFGAMVIEPLKNAMSHGAKPGDPIVIGIFLGDDGVCLGFWDGGDYFKSEETKKLFESRKKPEQRGKKTCVSGSHLGVGWIYHYTDIIEVDTETGILYLAQLKKNLALNEECMNHREEHLKFLMEKYEPDH